MPPSPKALKSVMVEAVERIDAVPMTEEHMATQGLLFFARVKEEGDIDGIRNQAVVNPSGSTSRAPEHGGGWGSGH